MDKRIGVALGCLLVIGVLVAACGGSSGKEETTPRARSEGAGTTASKRSAAGDRGADKSVRATKPVRNEGDRAQARREKREKQREAKKEKKLRRQQAALCDQVCDRMLECQLAYARENLTPDIVAAMKKPAERKKSRAKCREQRAACGEGDPDEERMDKARSCLRKKSCAASIECLDS